jgi:hypothetical protein
MSRYQLNKALRLCVFDCDTGPAERYKADPEAYAREFDLTDSERAPLVAGDIAALYAQGVQPFILVGFAVMLRDKPFTSGEDMMTFMKDYSQKVAPYGHPDFGT